LHSILELNCLTSVTSSSFAVWWGKSVVTKSRLLRQAKLLLKLAKATADPELAASLTARAADLQAEAELLTDEPDQPEKDA